MSRQEINCFKAYDIRGRVPDQLNEEIAHRIGQATAVYLQARRVVIGHDIRLSSPALSAALAQGLMAAGADVLDIGQCGTEEIYFATSHLQADAGIVVTASHNPEDFNGMKIVRESSKPVSGDTGLNEIRALAEAGEFAPSTRVGSLQSVDTRPAYLARLLSLVNVDEMAPLRIVVNAGNGGAGAIIDALEPCLPFEFIKLHHEPDGRFPNGVPNPLLIENRQPTIDAIREHGADMGLAWDGDFDRCFFFDEQGAFIEGYYIVGLLARHFLAQHPGAAIIHDPRLTWNTLDIVESAGGRAVQCKTGHAFIKERMRLENAVYGGEMSAHHYFRDFAFCDSGMIPWLLVAAMVSQSRRPLSALVAERVAAYPASGEINRRIEDPPALLAAVEARYGSEALSVDYTDGLSMAFERWRFNLRMSNTEPVVRLNVESRADRELMEEKTAELLAQMQ